MQQAQSESVPASAYVAPPHWLGMGQNPYLPPATFNPYFVGIGLCKIVILSFKAHVFVVFEKKEKMTIHQNS